MSLSDSWMAQHQIKQLARINANQPFERPVICSDSWHVFVSSRDAVTKIIRADLCRQGPNSFYWKEWLEHITHQWISTGLLYQKLTTHLQAQLNVYINSRICPHFVTFPNCLIPNGPFIHPPMSAFVWISHIFMYIQSPLVTDNQRICSVDHKNGGMILKLWKQKYICIKSCCTANQPPGTLAGEKRHLLLSSG